MSSKESRQMMDFFVIVAKGMRKHGVGKMLKTIQAIDLQANNMFYEDILNYIFKTVGEEYNVTKDEIIGRGKGSRGSSAEARKLVIILAKEHLDISDEYLSNQFERVRQVVYNARKEYENYNRENKQDKAFFEIYDNINNKIVNYIDVLKEEKK